MDYISAPLGNYPKPTMHLSTSYSCVDDDEKLQIENVFRSLDRQQLVVRVIFRTGEMVKYFPALLYIPDDMF